MQLVLSKAFIRQFKRLKRRNFQLRDQVEQALQQLAEDPFHPRLETHKLQGNLSDCWACSINYSNRIVFTFVENPDSGEAEILLLTLGSHDDVY